MALRIYVAHTGGFHEADARTFASVDELRKWLEGHTRLPAASQILMTVRGTNVKSNTLSNERELYLYDRKKLELSSKPSVEPVPPIQKPSPFPDDLESETDMSSWLKLFKKRKSWADSVLAHAQTLEPLIRNADVASRTMQKAVAVAFSNLETHALGLEGSLVKLREWAHGILEDRDRVLSSWEPVVKRLVRIPVHDELKTYVAEHEQRKVKVLGDFFDVKEVQNAATSAEMLAGKFHQDVQVLGNTIEDVCGRTGQLKSDIEHSSAAYPGNVVEKLEVLMQEINVLVKKVQTDYDYVRGLSGPKAASTASRRAYASTSDYLPGLVDLINDVGKLHQGTIEQKNAVSAECLLHLQSIALIQSLAAPVNPQINRLDGAFQEEDGNFQLLTLVLRLPTSYGSLLVECIRRREWSEKFSGNSQRLAEELAQLREDEEKRRKKWLRSTGQLLPFEIGDGSPIIRAELNTRGDANGGLPKITRQDLEAHLVTLKQIGGMEDAIKDINQALQDIDKPSRRVAKRLKGFKMGSVHENMAMSSSFFGTDVDQIKTLQREKEVLSERIKGYESRVHKLEDLLCRRTSSALGMNAGTPQPQTPVQQNFPPNTDGQPLQSPSLTQRTSDNANELALAQKITTLEAELAAEKEVSAQLKKESAQKAESEKEMTVRITHADDTKRDLVANLEQTVQDHLTERKDLMREIDMLKEKLEEAQNYVEELLEEERVKGLESELQAMSCELGRWKELANREEDHVKALEEQIAAVRREKDDELAALQAEIDTLTQRVDEESQRAAEAEAALEASEHATTRLTENVKNLEKTLVETKAAVDSERQQGLSHRRSQESMLSVMRQAHGMLSTDEEPPEDLTTLMDQLEALVERSVVRNKDLAGKLEASQSHASSLEQEHAALETRFETRTLQTKDLTQRLYTYHARCVQLLEGLGFRLVAGEGGAYQIVKISKSSSKDNVKDSVLKESSLKDSLLKESLLRESHLKDSLSLNRSSLLPGRSLSISEAPAAPNTDGDISLLYWMDSDTPDPAFAAFIVHISSLDLDAFLEALTARARKLDADHRVLMKQARNYREKAHRARDEADAKIAVKAFKPGDLALFLPTRNQITRPWAAFNVGAPHYFLHERDSHGLASRDWLLARITKITERVVDLSRGGSGGAGGSGVVGTGRPPSIADSATSDGAASVDDDNPFELSDGLRWYLIEAHEERPGSGPGAGAPSTPGLATSTVAPASDNARAAGVMARTPTNAKGRKQAASSAQKKLSEITEHAGSDRRSSNGSNRNSVASVRDLREREREARSPVAVNEVAVVEEPPPTRGEEKDEGGVTAEGGAGR